MGIGEVAALLGVGMAAGTINTVVGSGTLVTFPTLLAFETPADATSFALRVSRGYGDLELPR